MLWILIRSTSQRCFCWVPRHMFSWRNEKIFFGYPPLLNLTLPFIWSQSSWYQLNKLIKFYGINDILEPWSLNLNNSQITSKVCNKTVLYSAFNKDDFWVSFYSGICHNLWQLRKIQVIAMASFISHPWLSEVASSVLKGGQFHWPKQWFQSEIKMSIYNICFHGEKRKIICKYPLLSGTPYFELCFVGHKIRASDPSASVDTATCPNMYCIKP